MVLTWFYPVAGKKKVRGFLEEKTEMRNDELSPQATSGATNTPGFFL
jgi:hypothetical protein